MLSFGEEGYASEFLHRLLRKRTLAEHSFARPSET
jgi:hypothetical protein